MLNQQTINELNLKLEAIEIKNNIIKDEKESNEAYQDIEAQIKELREKQKQILEDAIPEVLSELDSLKKEYNEAVSKISIEYCKGDKKLAKEKKKVISKYNKLKYKEKYVEHVTEASEMVEINKEIYSPQDVIDYLEDVDCNIRYNEVWGLIELSEDVDEHGNSIKLIKDSLSRTYAYVCDINYDLEAYQVKLKLKYVWERV